MPRPIWKGTVAFGLVEIPVALHAAVAREKEIEFRLLDRRDSSPVGYERVNKTTGKPVPWDDVVKAYEHEKGEFVVLTEADLRRANVEATQRIDIVQFVDAGEIDPVYWDTPYYLEPIQKAKSRSYALLREALARSGRVGVGQIVIRSRQRLAALAVRGDVIVLDVLRYAYELRPPDELEVPTGSLRGLGLTDKEVGMAERLVESMAATWDPKRFRDSYRDDVLALVKRRVKAGKTEEVEEPERERRPSRTSDVLDLMPLLRRSVERSATRVASAAPRRSQGRAVRKKPA
jgi:DNA end-binding protein Ku